MWTWREILTERNLITDEIIKKNNKHKNNSISSVCELWYLYDLWENGIHDEGDYKHSKTEWIINSKILHTYFAVTVNHKVYLKK